MCIINLVKSKIPTWIIPLLQFGVPFGAWYYFAWVLQIEGIAWLFALPYLIPAFGFSFVLSLAFILSTLRKNEWSVTEKLTLISSFLILVTCLVFIAGGYF